MDATSPKWQLGESLIGTNPGLGFRPIAHDVDQGSLIWYDSSNKTQIEYWVERVDSFLNGNFIFQLNLLYKIFYLFLTFQ